MVDLNKPWKNHYIPPSDWIGRVDSHQPERYHQAVKMIDLTTNVSFNPETNNCALVGFQCDEGVKRNLGRPGAKKGPEAIRRVLSSLPCGLNERVAIYDAGNIICRKGNLEEAQKQLGNLVAYLIHQKATPILLGGGHEIAWGHYQGIALSRPSSNIAFINFDAHYDLRPLGADGQGNSGTSFTQISNLRKSQSLPFHYLCLGIQKAGNTMSLFEKAEQLNTTTVFAEDFYLGNGEVPMKALKDVIDRCDAIQLSLCMDVFAASFAPGVSAPQPLGLTPWQIIPLLRELASCGKLCGFDIAELSPPLDRDGQTARLTATLLAEFFACYTVKP